MESLSRAAPLERDVQLGVFTAADMDVVEIMEVEADAVLVQDDDVLDGDEGPRGPWGSLCDSSNMMRMCMQEDCPDGISVSSNTPYPYDRAALPRDAVSPNYFTAAVPVASDVFTSAAVAPTLAVEDADDAQSEYAVAATLRPFQCPTCRRVYVNEKGLVRHLRVMHAPRLWHVCDVCGKSLASPGSLRSHKWLHSNRRPFECPLCSAGFIRRPLLRAHLQSRHSAVANLAVKLERLDVNEHVPRRAASWGPGGQRQDAHHHDAHLEDDQDAHYQDAHHQDAHLQDMYQKHEDDRAQDVYHVYDSGAIVYVATEDGCGDSGLSLRSSSPSSPSSPSSSQAPYSEGTPSPASSATSEDSVEGHIVVRLVRDAASGAWKIDLGE